MADVKPRIPVVQGHNVWRLLRTDRDGAARDELPQMAAAACRHFLLHDAHRMDQAAKHEGIPTAPGEWRFGPARPFRVKTIFRSGEVRSPLPAGKILATRLRSAGKTVPTVSGEKPWFVDVEFWWREPSTTIPYPGLHEGLLGRSYRLNAADWTLDEARQVTDVTKPSDATWGTAMGSNARQIASTASTVLERTVLGLGSGAALLLVGYLILSRR